MKLVVKMRKFMKNIRNETKTFKTVVSKAAKSTFIELYEKKLT